MRITSWLVAVSCFLSVSFVSNAAFAERIKIGGYSGRPGYFALIGLAFDSRVDLIVTSAEAKAALEKNSIPAGGGTKDCEVEGMQQSIGTQIFYTLYKIKSCK